MKNNENMLSLKSQFGDEIITENLVVPLSYSAWQLLAQFQEQSGMSLPTFIERLLDDAWEGEW